MRPAPRGPERRSWAIAWVLTLAVHAAAIVGLWNAEPLRASSRPQPPAPIQLVFAPSAKQPAETGALHQFTELPPNRADVAPKKAEFLSNVTSRARDRVPGGEAALPRMQGEGDAPAVELKASDGHSAPPMASPDAPPNKPAAARPADTRSGDHAAPQSPSAANAAPAPPTKSAEADPTNQGGREIYEVTPGDAGSSEFPQPEMDNPGGNAELAGEVSLNTTAWDYAPWLQRFGRKLMHRWIPPMAYSIGLLKEGGWAEIEVEISKSGDLLRMQVLEERGHPSLSQAAQSALRNMPPIERLPADFPESTLILRIRMIYPRIRPR